MVDADWVVRICGDNPLIAPEEIDRLVDFYEDGLDTSETDRLYAFNHMPDLGCLYPDGFGAEILSRQLLERLETVSILPHQREHVTQYILDHPSDFDIRPVPVPSEIAYANIKLDVDTIEDLNKLKKLCALLTFESSAVDILKTYHKLFPDEKIS